MVATLYGNKIKYLQVILISFGILGFQLISIIPEFFGVDSRIITIPYRAFYLIVCILTFTHFRWGTKINRYFIPIIIFILLYFLRSLYDSITQYQTIKSYIIEFWLFAYLIGFLPMFVFLFKVNSVTLDKSKLVLITIAIIVNILGFKNNFGALNEASLGGRFTGNEILNQISYGQTGVILVIMCLSYFFNQSRNIKLILLPLIGLGLINVALSGSRGPMIELSMAIFFLVMFNFKKIGVVNIFIMLAIFVGLGIYFSDYLIYFNTVIDRLQETSFNQGSGSEERYYLFKEAWEQFLINPVFGFKAIGIYPHNLILESFAALGIIGGILMIYITIIAFKYCFELIRDDSTNWLGMIFLMHIIGTFISGTISNSFEFWSLLALSFSLNQNRIVFQNNKINETSTNRRIYIQ